MSQTVPSAVLGPPAPAKSLPTPFCPEMPPQELQQGQYTVLGAPARDPGDGRGVGEERRKEIGIIHVELGEKGD